MDRSYGGPDIPMTVEVMTVKGHRCSYDDATAGRLASHTCWGLVESYRMDRHSRQRVVAYLGGLKRSEQSGWAQLGRHLDKKARPHPLLFDPSHYDHLLECTP